MPDEFIYVKYGPCLEGDAMEDWDVESRPPGWRPGVGPYPSQSLAAEARRKADAREPWSQRRRGAQPGNTNAMKSGRYSPRMRELAERVLANPDVRELGEHLSRTKRNAWKREQMPAAEYAEKVRRTTERFRRQREAIEWEMEAAKAGRDEGD